MRSLFQCSQAKVGYSGLSHIPFIYCAEHRTLPLNYFDLEEGDPLECDTCKGCKDFSDMGKQVPRRERGW